LLRDQIQRTRTDIRSRTMLVELARQFGYASGVGQALRSALDVPNARLYQTATEPHERGSILVAAVFDAFFNTYQRRIRDLVRIATGGTGTLPEGDLHPDLVNRIATEAARTAQLILTMCIRAFDYLPPVDITFGDYLRALVTADYELQPGDDYGQRGAMIEAFRLRGIYADRVASLAEESLLWEPADPAFPKLPIETMEVLREMMFSATAFSRSSIQPADGTAQKTTRTQGAAIPEEGVEIEDLGPEMATQLNAYAKQHTDLLHLVYDRKIEVHGFHSVYRVALNGRLLIELIVQFAQTDRSLREELGGIPLRGGTTLIASADGTVRYVISKPLPSARLSPAKQGEAQARLDRQRQFLSKIDMVDPQFPYLLPDQLKNRMAVRMNLRALHAGFLG
jgi:hypothetical protein